MTGRAAGLSARPDDEGIVWARWGGPGSDNLDDLGITSPGSTPDKRHGGRRRRFAEDGLTSTVLQILSTNVGNLHDHRM